eukprot:1146643-Pelagomonas_calceolata.AAC.2
MNEPFSWPNSSLKGADKHRPVNELNDCGAGDARSFGRSHPPFTLFLQGVVLLPINFLLFNVRDIRRTNMAWKLLMRTASFDLGKDLKKTTQAVNTLPTSIKGRRIPRAEAPSILFTKRNKKEVYRDQEGY